MKRLLVRIIDVGALINCLVLAVHIPMILWPIDYLLAISTSSGLLLGAYYCLGSFRGKFE